MSKLGVSNPEDLSPFEDGVLQVVVETPKGSRNKFAWDEARRCFVLKKLLPAGMVFPFDFGFVPGTRAEDDGPIDVLLLMDEPAFPGCVVAARLVGVIEQEDHLPDGTVRRNDRLLAVAEVSDLFAHVYDLEDLADTFFEHARHFLESYPRLLGEKEARILGAGGPERAQELLQASLLIR
jgi:inorganic pyrophosphatase